ncbi:MAG: enoyl-CoA hydratase/isomerase family protein [Halobacteriales archaeon]
MSDPISVDAGEVTTIAVDRSEAMNALTMEAIERLEEAVRDAEEAGARVVVLAGAGDRAFVAGGDLAAMREFSPAEADRFAERGHRLCARLESFPAPVIAAIDGPALGAGLELALACDLRVASADVVFGEPEIDLGVMPGFGGTQRLPRHVGDERARRLLFLGERLDAEEALACGLVGEVVEPGAFTDRIEELAADIAARPAKALRGMKAALNARFDATLAEGLDREREEFRELFGTRDQREGMAAFLEDREPDFE